MIDLVVVELDAGCMATSSHDRLCFWFFFFAAGLTLPFFLDN